MNLLKEVLFSELPLTLLAMILLMDNMQLRGYSWIDVLLLSILFWSAIRTIVLCVFRWHTRRLEAEIQLQSDQALIDALNQLTDKDK